MPDDESYPSCFGPYLRYAISIGLRELLDRLREFEEMRFFDEERFRLSLLVELKQAEFVRAFEKAMARAKSSAPSSARTSAKPDMPRCAASKRR